MGKLYQGWGPWLLLLVMLLGLTLGGRHLYVAWLRYNLTQAQTQLLSSARTKAAQIAAWRHERLGDAEVLAQNPLLAKHLGEWMADGSQAELPAAIGHHLQALLNRYGYVSATVIDAGGRLRHTLGETRSAPALDDLETSHLNEAWRSRQAILSELHDDTRGYPHMHLIAPLFDGDQPAGAILLLIRASDALYPLIQSLPLPTRTGEAYLLRREGDRVVLISDLRHRASAALKMEKPLSDTRFPGVRAILGQTGVIEGTDYRGVAVSVAAQPIEGTGWMLIVKQDTDELVAPARHQAWLWGGWLLSVLGLLATGLGVLVWRTRRRQERLLLDAEVAEQASLRQFRNLFEQAQDGILLLTTDHRFLDANPAALSLLRLNLDELRRLRLPDILAPEEHSRLESAVGTMMGGQPHHQPWVHVRGDGSRFVGDVTAQPLSDETYFATLRDVTEQLQLRRQEAIHSAVLELLAHNAPLPDILDTIAHQVESAHPGMLCGILLLDDSGARLLAGAGPSLPDFYNQAVDGVAIGPGVGSCGEAAWTGQRVIASDLQTHPNWRPFRDLVDRAGLGACWSEPIHGSKGGVLGTFALYHRQPAAPTEEEIHLIEQLAKLAAIAIERQRASAALALSEQRYDMANQATSEVIWDWDIEAHTVWWNDNFYLHYGHDRAETPPSFDNWIGRVHPDDLFRVEDTLNADLAGTARVWSCQYRFRRHTGDYAMVSARGIIQRDAAGKALRLVGAMQDITELQQADQRLAEAADRYDRMLRATKDAFWLVEADSGRILDVNAAAETQSGYSREELLQRRVADIDVVHDPEQFGRRIAEILEMGWGVIETRHRTRSGRIIDVEVSTLPDAGKRKLIAFIRDITVRKQAELELRRIRDRLEAMLTAMPDLMFHLTSDGTFLDFRSAKSEQLYLSPEQFLGKRVREVLPTPASDIIMNAMATAITEGTVHGVSYFLPLPQGLTWFELSASRMQAGATDEPEVILLVRDITLRKRQEEQLRISELRHRILAENTRDVIWAMRPDGVITYVSPAVEQVRGYTPDEAMHQPIEEILSPSSLASAAEYLETLGADLQAGRPPQSYRGEQEYYRKDGSIFWAEVTVVPLLREDGSLVELIGVSRDIDERKRHEHELKQARDAADRANAAKSQFLAHMSHEIRTPMNAVLGLTQLLEREPLTPGQAAMIRHIGEAGDSLLRIINDILDFSKIEAGELHVDSRDFELAATLRQLDNLLGTTARRKGIELVISSADVPAWLVGDDQRLEQILINLIGNAIKFTEQGSITLTVRPVASDAETVRLRFEVRDTGIGIDAEGLSRLFQPFSQADSSITRRFGGTGLGLAICRRLAVLMGGALGADSVPGEGSTFWVELPYGLSAAAHQPAPAVTLQPDEPPAGARLAGLRVLLVDDNRINLMVATKALQLEGASVETAGDGQQALDRLRSGPTDFDAVLMDIQMPVMDGLTATREIRRDDALSGLPVIALTAGVLPEEHQAALDAGIDDFLNKPLQLDAMTSTLRRLTASHRNGIAS